MLAIRSDGSATSLRGAIGDKLNSKLGSAVFCFQCSVPYAMNTIFLGMRAVLSWGSHIQGISPTRTGGLKPKHMFDCGFS